MGWSKLECSQVNPPKRCLSELKLVEMHLDDLKVYLGSSELLRHLNELS